MTEDLQALADAAGSRADEQVRTARPALVSDLFWYGAVDIDPRHLVVWVMLRGVAEDLPRWYFPSGNPEADEAGACGLLEDLYALQSIVRNTFAEVGWPLPNVRVGFESDARARSEGGWDYFR